MQRRNIPFHKCMVWLSILLVLLMGIAPAFAEEAEEFVQPTRSPDANEYNPEHPEDLQQEQLIAASAILIEANSGQVIFEKNADQMMYPASTTKILTVLLGLTLGKTDGLLDQTVTASEYAVDIPDDSTRIPLSAGESINFLDLLYATMIKSGNDGANVIAESVSGSVEAFADLMNQAAQSFGCTSTHFTNPHGLHDPNHYTTARDMAIIAREAMENSTFRQIVATTSYAIPASNQRKARTVENTNNPFMVQSENNNYYYNYATGIKTGFHNQAGYCYVGSATKNGVTLISVVFYTSRNGRWADTKMLMEYGFSQYVSVSPVDLYQMNPIVVETNGFSQDDPDLGRLPLNLVPVDSSATAAIIATKSEVEALARNLQQLVIIEYTRGFSAPITAGETIGMLTYFPTDGSDPVEYNLIASRSIAKRENAPKSIEEIEAEVYADPNPFPPLTLEMVILFALPLVGIYVAIRIIRRVFGSLAGRGDHNQLPKPTSRRYR